MVFSLNELSVIVQDLKTFVRLRFTMGSHYKRARALRSNLRRTQNLNECKVSSRALELARPLSDLWNRKWRSSFCGGYIWLFNLIVGAAVAQWLARLPARSVVTGWIPHPDRFKQLTRAFRSL